MNINLKPYRLLIIDDFAQFRLTLKKMLERKGAEHIDQAGNAVDALKACAGARYDLIFCDYNLGDGQDGQQLLEEMHQRSLLPKSSLFIMVTAEMMSAQVIGALEYQPDAYLGKPFPFEQLSQRVDRLVSRHELLKGIYRELEAGEVDRALLLCDQIAEQTPALRFTCRRIKVEILEQQQEFDAAGELCQDVVAEQPLLWAMLGIGKRLFYKDRIDEALAHFQAMRETHPRQIIVIDWIVQCLQRLEETEKSEQALIEAIDLSPKSVARQARLGEIAEQLEHYEIARKAWSRTINEDQYSCLVSGDNYRHYFDNTGKLLGDLEGRERSRAIADIERTAKNMETRYRQEPGELAAGHCALVGLFREAGRNDLCDRSVARLAQALEHPRCSLSEENQAYIEGKLNALDDAVIGEKSRTRIDDRLQRFRQASEERNRQDEIARGINQQGLDLFDQEQPGQALDRFREALVVMPDNPTYLLNAAQMVLLHEQLRNDADLMREARDWMRRISLRHDDRRRPLYQMLRGRMPSG